MVAGMTTDSTRNMTIPDYRLDPPEPMKVVECPYCGTSLFDYLVEDAFGAIVGCSECTRQLTAEEYLEEEED